MFLVDCRILKKSLRLNRDKRIGKVLFIVEGGKTESYLLRKIFTQIFDYELNTILREKGFKQYNSKINKESHVIVIPTLRTVLRYLNAIDCELTISSKKR